MGTASFAWGAYERTGNPTLVARNCYAEEYPSASGSAIQMRERPGLSDFKTVGVGAFRAIFAKDGVFDNSAAILNGTTLSLLSSTGVETAITGTVAGNDLADIDGGIDSTQDPASNLVSLARIATGSGLYKAQGGIVTLEDFPDVGGAGAASVCYHRGFWIAVDAETFLVYVLVPGDTAWVNLSFVSADYGPDKMVAVRSRGDQIALLGSSTTEIWTLNTAAADPPLVPFGGLFFDYGCRSRPSAINCTGTLIWVDNNCIVRRWDGGAPTAVSGPGLAEIIKAVGAADLRAWTFNTEAHRFYVLTIGSVATWVYDLDGVGERWTTFDSLGYDYWRASLGCTLGAGDATIALDLQSSQIWKLDPTLHLDGDDVFAVEASFSIEGGDKAAPLGSVALLMDIGDAPREGQGSSALAGLKLSRNQGKTFTEWDYQDLAQTGEYDNLPIWNGQGDIPRFTGIVGRVRIADPMKRVLKKVFVGV